MDSIDARLHYTRLFNQTNKMYDSFFNDKNLEDSESTYYNFLVNNSYYYKYYDLDNMLILCSIALMGLNKEAIEDSVNHLDYKYNINYSVPSYDAVIDTYMKKYNIPKQNKDILKNLLKQKDINKYSFFNEKRIFPTGYDKWLKVEAQNNLPNFTYNYLSCVRDALMHSEYLVKEDSSNNNLSFIKSFMEIKNSDYKKLDAKIFVPNYLDFIKYYYSNLAYYGVINSFYSLETDDEFIKHIDDEKNLKELVDNVSLIKMNIKNKSLEKEETFEYKNLKNKGMIYSLEKDDENLEKENIDFSAHNKKVVIKLINEYYGNSFYFLDQDRQFQIIFNIVSYVYNPKSVISAGIIAIYENVINVGRKNEKYVTLSEESYCLKTVLLILKLYTILYRIQNKNFEEIDYSKMNLINFDYNEANANGLNLYTEYKNKLINKGIYEDENTYQKRYITEIIRDALAHGNISMSFDIKDNKVIQKIVFNDEYKSKNRTISIALDELNKYILSPCFEKNEVILKTDEEKKIKVKSKI